jgi:F420-dependent oxidoreductase-like protein
MRLGLRLELYRQASVQVPVDLVRRAEDAGYHSVWTAEAYGTDALSPLAYLAALTTRIKLGTAVAQVAARPPTTLAMHAMTIDAMAGGGRVIVGVGLSGPQIVEGWYGQPWGKPATRLRDYVTILRQTLARETPVAHDGAEISLPYTGPGAIGQGKPLKSILHSSGDVEIWIAAGGNRNVTSAAELADGWLPMGLPHAGTSAYAAELDAGFSARSPALSPPEDFDVFTGCTVLITDDVAGALDSMRPLTAMYVGGMGSATHNYHRDSMARRGFPDEADTIVRLWRSGEKAAATAAVPDDYLEQTALIGSPQRIRRRWAEGVVAPGCTGVIVGTSQPEAIDLMADLTGTE